jgi:glycosyltransferase involved in cell wall biosynthesis
MSGIHQFVPMLHRYDAVGEHTRALRDLLVGAGIPSRIYSELPDPGTVDETHPYLHYADDAEAGDVLIYQFATESVMAGWLTERPEPLVVNYHSVTPPGFFAPWNNGIARLQVATLAELELVASRAELGIAVSRFDEGELREAGCTTTVVIPVANLQDPPAAPDPVTVTRLQHEAAGRRRQQPPARSWLSVGRLAPNKGHHETVAALFVTRMTSDPGAHLTLIGAPSEPAYARALHRYVATLGLEDAVEFVSGIDDAELAAHYQAGDVLVMLSDHEGFGVPLVEAMGRGLPVVAYDAGAVREVIGDAGVLLDRKHPRHVAAVVDQLLTDAEARRTMVERGEERFADLDVGTAGRRLVETVMALRRGLTPSG